MINCSPSEVAPFACLEIATHAYLKSLVEFLYTSPLQKYVNLFPLKVFVIVAICIKILMSLFVDAKIVIIFEFPNNLIKIVEADVSDSDPDYIYM